MFITRECDYAVRIIRELADGSIKNVKEICEKEYIPVQFAYKILKKLEKGGLVRSFRGIKGGYQLDKSSENITLYDIFLAVEEQLYINECLNGEFECPKNSKDHPCKVHKELLNLQNAIADGLKEKTMAEILNG